MSFTDLTYQRAWLTALANDQYLTPTLALSQTLDLFSCVKKKIILVPDDSHSVRSYSVLRPLVDSHEETGLGRNEGTPSYGRF